MSNTTFVAQLSTGRNAAFDKITIEAADIDHALEILKKQGWLKGRGTLCQLTLSDDKTVEEYDVFKSGAIKMTDNRDIG